MKLKIINPAVGISQEQIKAWQQYLSEFLLPDTILEFENIPSGFPALENKTQDIINGAEVLKIVARAQEESVQGFLLTVSMIPRYSQHGSFLIFRCWDLMNLPSYLHPCWQTVWLLYRQTNMVFYLKAEKFMSIKPQTEFTK